MKLAIVLLITLAAAHAGETLGNGIVLPDQWPPVIESKPDQPPLTPPYLQNKPAVILIDVGRQLFVDDFLIESTTLRRVWHQPVKHEGNPVLQPEQPREMARGFTPMAAPFSDGCFYDPVGKRFMLWYSAGWYDSTALAVSDDGAHWTRPSLDVFPGSNLVALKDHPQWRRDTASVWLDHDAKSPGERFKATMFCRTGEVGGKLDNQHPGLLFLASPDGIHWTLRGQTAHSEDNTTMFFNPFRKRWVFSHRIHVKTADGKPERARAYWESPDFFAGAGDAFEKDKPVFWARADAADLRDAKSARPPQLYKIDATPYESLMLGLFEMLGGETNEEAAQQGAPKRTDLQVAFSRDGFHWDRPRREPFIGCTGEVGSWERGYISSCGGGCLVVGDELWFYYGAFKGDPGNTNENIAWSGLYANGATGLAKLRRDGFASMNASEEGELTTALVRFSGKHLFVNLAAVHGGLRAEILDAAGHVIAPFTRENCEPLSVDSTRVMLPWKGADSLASLARKPVRFRFHLNHGALYAFWISGNERGASNGYVAAGGPGFSGPADVDDPEN